MEGEKEREKIDKIDEIKLRESGKVYWSVLCSIGEFFWHMLATSL